MKESRLEGREKSASEYLAVLQAQQDLGFGLIIIDEVGYIPFDQDATNLSSRSSLPD